MIKKVLIIGAGKAGEDVAREIKISSNLNMKVVGFIDDNKNKVGKDIAGIKVIGTSAEIPSVAKKQKVDEIIIATPSANSEIINKFVNTVISLKLPYKIVPRVREIIEDKAKLSSLRKVDVSDLIGRPIIKSDVDELKPFFQGKTILVTGAAGSIGSELSAQIAAYKPRRLILFDVWENGVYELRRDFIDAGYTKNINYIIGNVRDTKRLEEIFARYKPEFVFHAAAYKHVPLMEENPTEAIKNNVLGTYHVATISNKYKVMRFVLVSTDKAAEPENVMGMTKLFAEKIVRSIKSSTKYMVVRFGNVLDSNGSVVPLFRKQIEKGGPLTVTDTRMTRYFMTIPEASSLILKSAYLGRGGELFVLDMGEPVSILDLAQKMIRLSGLIPDKDIKIVFTGVRKGEKLTEKLFTKTEKLGTTIDSKIFASTKGSNFKNLKSKMTKVKKLVLTDTHKNIKSNLKKLVHEK